MQKKIIATLVVASAVITVVSCKWFQANPNKQFTIVGQWKIDSMYATNKDSSGNMGMALMMLPLAMGTKNIDSTIVLEFNADSTCSELLNPKAVKKYYLQDSTLYLKEDSAYDAYRLNVSNDSLISLTSKDSLVMVLKKQ